MTLRQLFLMSILISMMVGCSSKNPLVQNARDMNTSSENLESISQNPPQMKIEINGEQFMAALSGYAWSYFDPEENAMATVQAESISPSELLGNRSAPKVNSKTSIQFKFETDPLSYKVTIWEAEKNLKSSSDMVVLDGQTGRTIYEVTATWEQGTAHYFFPLMVE